MQLKLAFLLSVIILIMTLPSHAKVHELTDTVWTAKLTPNPFQEVVSAVSFSPDGKTIAAGTDQGNIFIIKTETGEVLKHFGGQYAGIYQLIYSPNGRILVTRQGRNIFLWDVDKGDTIVKLTQEIETTSMDFSNDGKTLMFSLMNPDTNNVRFLDVETKKVVRRLNIPAKPYCVRYSNNNDYIAIGIYNWSDPKQNSNILLWDAKKYKQIADLGTLHYGLIDKMEFSSNDKYLISINGGIAKIWNVEQKILVDSLSNISITSLSFPKDNQYIVTGDYSGYVDIWDITNGELKHRYEEIYVVSGIPFSIYDIDVSKDNKYIIATLGNVIGLINAKFDFSAIKEYPDEIKHIQISTLSNQSISIQYSLSHNGLTKIKLFNVSGNIVKDIPSEQQDIGEHEVNISSAGLSPGVYFCLIKNGNYSKSVKLILE